MNGGGDSTEQGGVCRFEKQTESARDERDSCPAVACRVDTVQPRSSDDSISRADENHGCSVARHLNTGVLVSLNSLVESNNIPSG